MKDRRLKRFQKFTRKQQIKEDKQEVKEDIPQEDLELHPELSRETSKEARPARLRMHRFVPKEMVERFNRTSYTNLILSLAIIMGIIYLVFGILGIIAIFGDDVWNFYIATKILGWKQLKITGFILVIIGIVMIWSVPLYILNKTQQGDSYLVIASGLGILFGGIYLLIIIADILSAAVIAITESTSIHIETFFYIPIMLAVVVVPLFRILVIRHMVVLPDVGKNIPISAKWKKQHGGRHHFHKQWRSHWRKHHRHKKKEQKKE
ncbi:MAG: DUF308 domain-containing protein [Asgard group archaeon]|nr:DUF308 domain-containing protein [Asgard group archaeon]